MSSRFVGLFLCLYFNAEASKMSWCDYWNSRGVPRAECQPVRSVHWSLAHDSRSHRSTMQSMPICDLVYDWSRCQKSVHCPLGLLCWHQGSPCCTPQGSAENSIETSEQCPSRQQLGVECAMKNPVNWCNRDSDCHMSNAFQKCCPSGCGYNMCVHLSPNINIRSRMASMSHVPDFCPSMDTLSIRCVTNGVSWCNSHSDCLSSQVQRRLCCPTRCGYNVCLLQQPGSKWIIA